jgi:hypothetical protein
MYNKLFTKILDSSIWLESTSTRLVWLTMIAAMDETGFTQFASIPNLAHRARVSIEEATAAVECLESVDLNSSDPENEGRRIEKVPGGWMVLNAGKYRDLVKRSLVQEQTRQRVAAFRSKKVCNAGVTLCNANQESVTQEKRPVTPSDTPTATKAETETKAPTPKKLTPSAADAALAFEAFWNAYPRKKAKGDAEKAWKKVTVDVSILLKALEWQKRQTDWTRDSGRYIPYPASWLNDRGWEDEPSQQLPGMSPSAQAAKDGRHYPGPQTARVIRVPDDV